MLLFLTGDGRRRVARAAPVIQQANDVFFGALDGPDFGALCDIAARLEAGSERAVGHVADLAAPA